MTSPDKQMKTKVRWFLDHILAPAIIAFGVVFLNNHYQAKKLPKLVARAVEHRVTKISENNFKIECPFKVWNDGGSLTKNRKLTLSIISTDQTINDIYISEEYKCFYNEEDGGRGSNFVVLSINLPKGKKIDGSIVFFSNTEIPEKSMCPLNIIY